jgi:hypothetical protein
MPNPSRTTQLHLRARSSLLALVLSLCLPAVLGTAVAGAAWSPVGGVSAINHAHDRSAYDPSMTVIDGVPYVAWSEWGATDNVRELRVSRLNAAGTGWEEVGDGIHPTSQSGFRGAENPSIAAVDGVPYVAWQDRNDRNAYEIRVSRLNAAGTEWEEVVGGTSPINHTPHAEEPSLAVAGGVPYVTWWETDGFNSNVWVSRLNAAGTAWEPVGGPSPLDHTDADGASNPSIASIKGVPHVAWDEWDGDNAQIRVSRLDAAGTGWEEIGGGPSPINHDPNMSAEDPSLASVGGVPHVAWSEYQQDWTLEVRVSRLNAAGTAWEEIGGGPSPINQRSDDFGGLPSLAAAHGVPYVAWLEDSQVRVSRPNAAGTAWEEVVGGASPINLDSEVGGAFEPSLATIGGVPYVARFEGDGDNYEIQVSRLEPEFLSQAALATDTEALVLSRVRTYGVAYPIAFQYGADQGLGERTRATRTAHGSDTDTAFRVIRRLAPETSYFWRPIGFDGWRATGTGPTATFTTKQAFVPTPPRLLVALLRGNLRTLAGRGVTVRYLATRAANITLDVRRGGKLVASVPGRARAGRNRVSWDGRIAGRRPRPGRYTLVVRAASGDGQRASDRASLRIARRHVDAK